MPATSPAVDSDPAVPSSGDDSVEDKPSNVNEVLRKLLPHPSTAVMVKEALAALDSRKGVATLAIHNFIKQKYPSVDMGRAKTLIRKALNKGLENGTVVRPANSSDGTGSRGRFRLAPTKKTKPKKENNDPNVDGAKDGAKEPKKAGSKKEDSTKNQTKTEQEPKPPKKSKKTEESATKTALEKKPKAKVAAAEKVEADSGATKAKGDVKAATKAKSKAAATKEGKATKSKAVKTGSGTSKATGGQRKKAAE